MMTNLSKSSYKKWLSGISLISLDQELANLEGAIERNTDDSELVNSIKEKVQVVLQEIHKRNGYSNVS